MATRPAKKLPASQWDRPHNPRDQVFRRPPRGTLSGPTPELHSLAQGDMLPWRVRCIGALLPLRSYSSRRWKGKAVCFNYQHNPLPKGILCHLCTNHSKTQAPLIEEDKRQKRNKEKHRKCESNPRVWPKLRGDSRPHKGGEGKEGPR